MNKKVASAMSGGVDSSAATLILISQGYKVLGVSMLISRAKGVTLRERECSFLDDLVDAREVARRLAIPYLAVDLSSEFTNMIMKPFAEAYLKGLTPNPCIRCNRIMKFGYLFDRVAKLGYQFIASGHYARVEYDRIGKRYLLKKGKDKDHDQSYFLFELSQDQLSRLIFPLGGVTRDEVRELADKEGIPISEKRSSQEICFVPGNKYSEVVERFYKRNKAKGEIVDISGRLLGYHRGIHQYTVGQRRKLGLALGEPFYVIEIDQANNRVVVGPEEQLMRTRLIACDVNLIAFPGPVKDYPVVARIRYKHQGEEAVITSLSGGKIMVEFKKPVRAITPGQAVVFYGNDTVVGGAWIERIF
jgi:tRNA-specific 2-thiouridylase